MDVLVANAFWDEGGNSCFLQIFFFCQNCVLNTAVTHLFISRIVCLCCPLVFQIFACQALLQCCNWEEDVFLLRGLWTLIIVFVLSFYAESMKFFPWEYRGNGRNFVMWHCIYKSVVCCFSKWM